MVVKYIVNLLQKKIYIVFSLIKRKEINKTKKLRQMIPRNPASVRKQDKVQLRRWGSPHLQSVHTIRTKFCQPISTLIAFSECVVEGHRPREGE